MAPHIDLLYLTFVRRYALENLFQALELLVISKLNGKTVARFENS
jgi:hypothetical protein